MVHGWALILALSCALGREEQRVTLCRASTDGVGSQYYQRMLLWLRACREGLVYVNTPMPVVPRHNVSAEMAARVDAYQPRRRRCGDGGGPAAAACLPCAHAGERVKTFHNARERGNERSADDACYRAAAALRRGRWRRRRRRRATGVCRTAAAPRRSTSAAATVPPGSATSRTSGTRGCCAGCPTSTCTRRARARTLAAQRAANRVASERGPAS